MKDIDKYFDLDQQIMTCWSIIDDLDALLEGILEKELTRDEISNIVLGLKSLYNLKFEKLHDLYEQSYPAIFK